MFPLDVRSASLVALPLLLYAMYEIPLWRLYFALVCIDSNKSRHVMSSYASKTVMYLVSMIYLSILSVTVLSRCQPHVWYICSSPRKGLSCWSSESCICYPLARGIKVHVYVHHLYGLLCCSDARHLTNHYNIVVSSVEVYVVKRFSDHI